MARAGSGMPCVEDATAGVQHMVVARQIVDAVHKVLEAGVEVDDPHALALRDALAQTPTLQHPCQLSG